jgi:ADP-ribosylglycohydrolase
VCCAVYCVWARRALRDPGEGSDSAVRAAVETVRAAGADAAELALVRNALDTLQPGGSGYVVDSLVSAVAVNREPTYEAVVKEAIALGHDTDTTACIAGGIAGIRRGVDGIPARWLEALRGKHIADELLDRLLAEWRPAT